MSEQVKRYGVVTTWNDGCTEKIGSHIEEQPDGIYCLVAEQATTIERLREALKSYVRVSRCEDPRRERGPNPFGYRACWLLYDCGECRHCKATAALKET